MQNEGNILARHTIKYTHINGLELEHYEAWCGRDISVMDWYFTGAQHVALAVGGSVQPCKKCIKAIIKELRKEL